MMCIIDPEHTTDNIPEIRGAMERNDDVVTVVDISMFTAAIVVLLLSELRTSKTCPVKIVVFFSGQI